MLEDYEAVCSHVGVAIKVLQVYKQYEVQSIVVSASASTTIKINEVDFEVSTKSKKTNPLATF